jgi:hypothetical protein
VNEHAEGNKKNGTRMPRIKWISADEKQVFIRVSKPLLSSPLLKGEAGWGLLWIEIIAVIAISHLNFVALAH